MAVIKAEKVKKIYGKKDAIFTALNGVNISFEEGESAAIIGKSGSGKSTLMHLLALLDEPSEGSVFIDGHNAQELSKKELNQLRNKSFGFVFQQFFINGNDSVINNVILPLKIAGVSSRERSKRAMAVLKEVGLSEKAKNKANDLSGGQKQRLVIARAIINEPRVIFADEPTGNLDSVTGEKIENLLFKLNKKKGITLIIVTHDKDLAKRCSREIHIKDGKIISGGKK